MSYYERLASGHRFGRIFDDLIKEHMPEDIGKIVDYLIEEHTMQLEGIYLENYKCPDRVIVMKGKLPIEAVKVRFGKTNGLVFNDCKVTSSITYSALEGSES